MKLDIVHKGPASWIIFDEAERRNPLTADFIEHMQSALDALEAREETRVVVLTGRGSVFCAGASMGEVIHPDGMDIEAQYRLIRGYNAVVRRIRSLDLPVIAAVNGPAAGGGAALALAADFAVASSTGALMFVFGRVGAASADMGCTWLLSRLVGPARARHLLLTGARVDAAQARELGLFIDVVAPEELESTVQDIAEQIVAAGPRRAAAATKLALGLGDGIDLSTALDYEAFVQGWMFQTPEHKDRLAAFMAGKKP